VAAANVRVNSAKQRVVVIPLPVAESTGYHCDVASTRIDTAALTRLLGDWSGSDHGLADSLADAVMDLVDTGLLPPGVELPPQRDLSNALGVSRGTVAMAAQILEMRGYLESRQGSGSRIRVGAEHAARVGQGRFLSFTDTPADVIDLSSGALPASPVTREVLATVIDGDLDRYLDTDGYFPAGLPTLRQAIADHLSADGMPTRPSEILVTTGGQQALDLAVRLATEPGDLVLVEEPTYRGALEVAQAWGARVEGVPAVRGGIDVDLVAHAVHRRPAALYCQTSIHNPTGQSMRPADRRALADVVNAAGLPTIEDCSSYEITLTGRPARSLAGLVDPGLLITIGTLSKLFWGGLRVGWIRTDEARVRLLLELRKSRDLASAVPSQLWATRLLARSEEARRQRRDMLTECLAAAEPVVAGYFPGWTWQPIEGGSGLWIDTHADALAIAEVARRAKVKLAAGPGFSAYGGQRSMLRLPVWHESALLRRALELVASGLRGRRAGHAQ
jgi:DNA-binding transcriptional MocR family regulator